MPDPNVRYVAFGDSATAGVNGRAYPEILRELLGEPEGSFANEGEGGETTQEGLVRIQDLLDADLFPNADVWLYWLGGNDAVGFVGENDPQLHFPPNAPDYPFAVEWSAQLDETQMNIESAINLLHEAGKQVFVATIVPVDSNTADCPPLAGASMSSQQADVANGLILQLNEAIRVAVDGESAIFVDMAAAGDELRADPVHYTDCNHLSEQGNEIVAAVFLNAIRMQTQAPE
jgi:lysophospholipase L1-like esterase